MKKYFLFVPLILCITTCFALQVESGNKYEKKQEKMDKKSTEMENATRKGNDKKAIKKTRKMDKKEKKSGEKS